LLGIKHTITLKIDLKLKWDVTAVTAEYPYGSIERQWGWKAAWVTSGLQ